MWYDAIWYFGGNWTSLFGKTRTSPPFKKYGLCGGDDFKEDIYVSSDGDDRDENLIKSAQ